MDRVEDDMEGVEELDQTEVRRHLRFLSQKGKTVFDTGGDQFNSLGLGGGTDTANRKGGIESRTDRIEEELFIEI